MTKATAATPGMSVRTKRRSTDGAGAADRARMNGQAETYLRDEDAVARDRVVLLRRQLQIRFVGGSG